MTIQDDDESDEKIKEMPFPALLNWSNGHLSGLMSQMERVIWEYSATNIKVLITFIKFVEVSRLNDNFKFDYEQLCIGFILV